MSKNVHRKQKNHDKKKMRENGEVKELSVPKHFQEPSVKLFFVNSQDGPFVHDKEVIYFDCKMKAKALRNLMNKKIGKEDYYYVSKGPQHCGGSHVHD